MNSHYLLAFCSLLFIETTPEEQAIQFEIDQVELVQSDREIAKKGIVPHRNTITRLFADMIP